MKTRLDQLREAVDARNSARRQLTAALGESETDVAAQVNFRSHIALRQLLLGRAKDILALIEAAVAWREVRHDATNVESVDAMNKMLSQIAKWTEPAQ